LPAQPPTAWLEGLTVSLVTFEDQELGAAANPGAPTPPLNEEAETFASTRLTIREVSAILLTSCVPEAAKLPDAIAAAEAYCLMRLNTLLVLSLVGVLIWLFQKKKDIRLWQAK
jgi:hypothetical protein